MIILDTNLLSPLMRDRPDAAVITWLAAITVLDVRTGLELLRASRRRTQLESAFDQLLRDDLDGRVLAFDTAAANAAGVAVAAAQRRGQSIEPATARSRGSRSRDAPPSLHAMSGTSSL